MSNTCAVNSICGWQYPVSTIRDYLRSDEPRLLTMDFDFPCKTQCSLRCKYCFVKTDERESATRQHIKSEKLSVCQLKDIFTQAFALGCRSAKLVGDQEPLQESEFIDFAEYVSEQLGMWLVVFTNGYVLAFKELCKRIHGCEPIELIQRLKKLRISIMLKFHSFNDVTEDKLVGISGYAVKRNYVLALLEEAGFNDSPSFASDKEKYEMTGARSGDEVEDWTRLGLESVITPQSLRDAERIYKLKGERRLFVDLDPPVPVGLTRNRKWREKLNLHVTKEKLLELAILLYRMNEELGIAFQGASPYFGALPCSQLPYGLYINARGRIYPCCGCPDIDADGRSEYLGNIRDPNALAQAIAINPYRINYKKHGYAYDKRPFNDSRYPGYGIYHGCPYRDRAGDLMPQNWEVIVDDYIRQRKPYEKASKREVGIKI